MGAEEAGPAVPAGRPGAAAGGPPSDVIVAEEAVDRRVVAMVLRTGLAVACALMAAGLTVTLARGDRHAHVVRLFEIGGDQSAGDLLLAAGVVVLALTPTVRVLALVVLWAREGDRRFVAVALVVVAVLVAAAAIGHG